MIKRIFVPFFAVFALLAPDINTALAAVINGRAWNDLNRNGLQEAGEPGITNLSITLFSATSNFVDATSSGAEGSYSFSSVSAGTYFVRSLPLASDPLAVTIKDAGGDDTIDNDLGTNLETDSFVVGGSSVEHIDHGYYELVASMSVTTRVDGVLTPGFVFVTNNQVVTFVTDIRNTGEASLSSIYYIGPDSAFTLLLECPSTLNPGAHLSITQHYTATLFTTGTIEVVAFPVDLKTCTFLNLPPQQTDTNIVFKPIPGNNFTLFTTLTSPVGRPMYEGETATFQIELSNTGGSAANHILVADVFESSDFIYNGATPSADSSVPGLLTWTNLGVLHAGASTSILISMQAQASTFGSIRTSVVVASLEFTGGTPLQVIETNETPYVISKNGDSDDDEIPDAWEDQYGLNKFASNAPNSNADTDWMTDLEEYWADTNPTNPLSYFAKAIIGQSTSGTIHVTIPETSTNRLYQVRKTAELLSAQNWILNSPDASGTGSNLTLIVTNAMPYEFIRTGVRLP